MPRSTTKKTAAPKKAAPKKKSTSKAVAKAGSKALMSVAELKRQLAGTGSAGEETAVGGDFISIRNSKFSFKEQNLGQSIEVIILDYSFVRTYYDQPFNADEPSSPACYAIAFDESEMAPADDVVKQQCDSVCNECELDVWGSDDSGEGKACKEMRRLAILSADNDLSKAEVAFINIPPSSLKNWKGFIKPITDKLGVKPNLFVTKISFDEDADYPKLQFEIVEELETAEDLTIVLEKTQSVEEQLLNGYDADNYHEPVKKKRGKATTKKKARR